MRGLYLDIEVTQPENYYELQSLRELTLHRVTLTFEQYLEVVSMHPQRMFNCKVLFPNGGPTDSMKQQLKSKVDALVHALN